MRKGELIVGGVFNTKEVIVGLDEGKTRMTTARFSTLPVGDRSTFPLTESVYSVSLAGEEVVAEPITVNRVRSDNPLHVGYIRHLQEAKL